MRQKLAQALVDLDDMQYQRDLAMKMIKRLERERDSLRIDAQREAENHDRTVGELEGLYEQIEAMNRRLREP